jgi:lysozyme
MKKVSSKGLALIRSFEGLRLDAYRCPAGIWTIGYGHTTAAGPPSVRPGMKITHSSAISILEADVQKFVDQIRAVTPNFDKLPQDAFDAVASFVFNVGLNNFWRGGSKREGARGSVWRGVVAQNPKMIAMGMRLYIKAGGKVLPGLIKRREIEARMVENAVWATPVTTPVTPTPPPAPKSWWQRAYDKIAFWR